MKEVGLYIKIPLELKKRIKMLSVEKGTSMKNIILEVIRKEFTEERENEKVMKAIIDNSDVKLILEKEDERKKREKK